MQNTIRKQIEEDLLRKEQEETEHIRRQHLFQ